MCILRHDCIYLSSKDQFAIIFVQAKNAITFQDILDNKWSLPVFVLPLIL